MNHEEVADGQCGSSGLINKFCYRSSVPSTIKRHRAARSGRRRDDRRSSSTDKRCSEFAGDVVDNAQVRKIHGACVLNHHLVGDFERAVIKCDWRSVDFFGNRNVGDDDWRWIVTKRSVTIVFAILACWIGSVVTVISGSNWSSIRVSQWVAVFIEGFASSSCLVFKSL